MARLLFIENREKTFFWAEIARRLQKEGHEIVWLVQNPVFGRALPGRRHLIPFPRAHDLEHGLDLAAFPALATDRGREHFAAGQAHYAYYADRIEAIIDREAPDVTIGEPTLFHELLALDLCERKGIPFAHPVGERYPDGRFAIFAGASQRPIVESGDSMDDALALDLATRIADGRKMPTYIVRGGRLARSRSWLRWAATRGRVITGRWQGERYNTPSPIRKLALNRSARANLRRWTAAASMPPSPDRTILYPLQMQPENTIDVWGRPDWDQAAIVRRILAATPPNVMVSLKANPKPYYELSDVLLDACLEQPRVHLLPVEMSMVEALSRATGAITITGTVGYEAVCGRGRCLSIAHPILEEDFPNFAAPSVEAAAVRLLADPDAGKGSPAEGARLLQRLTARSFEGIVADPVSLPDCMAPANLDRVARGISSTIQYIGQRCQV
ncbi:MAG TPA: hypothetical protein VEX35_11195 [Allosphingosinicella sp.]|nr:hypothetical protein [Allosphingosinicella sp.]